MILINTLIHLRKWEVEYMRHQNLSNAGSMILI